MENYKDIIIRPIITEKTMRYMDADNKVTFEVKKGTNKTQVKQAVEAIFGVDVEKVNIVNVKPKTKRMGKDVGSFLLNCISCKFMHIHLSSSVL